MHIDIFTLFPEMFAGPLTESILKRAQEMGALSVHLHNFREWAEDKHRMADDTPYGGDGGMVLKPEPLVRAVEAIIPAGAGIPVILTSPQGRTFTQTVAEELAGYTRIAIICGHYEAVDERVLELVVTDEISLGDYVLTGGELAAMVMVDAITRLLPDVLGDPEAPQKDSHATGLLEHPHYTRPPSFRGLDVPEVLLSGHAAKIARWRREQSLRRTWQRRPDLLLTAGLDKHDRAFLLTLAEEEIRKSTEH